MLKLSRIDSFGYHQVRIIDSTYDSDLGAWLEHLVGERTFSTNRGADNWMNKMIKDYSLEHGHVKIMS